jgi:hypothetical protein
MQDMECKYREPIHIDSLAKCPYSSTNLVDNLSDYAALVIKEGAEPSWGALSHW